MEHERLTTHIPQNQKVIDFLYRCMDATDHPYKKKAYQKAINEIYSYWSVIVISEWVPQTIGPSISRKICEFLEGFPEEDILYS